MSTDEFNHTRIERNFKNYFPPINPESRFFLELFNAGAQADKADLPASLTTVPTMPSSLTRMEVFFRLKIFNNCLLGGLCGTISATRNNCLALQADAIETMNHTSTIKLRQDRIRFYSALKKNRNLVPLALRIMFGNKIQVGIRPLVGQLASGEKLHRWNRKSHMDTSILSQLVGLGFVRPEGKNYLLTSKGAKAINESLLPGQGIGEDTPLIFAANAHPIIFPDSSVTHLQHEPP